MFLKIYAMKKIFILSLVFVLCSILAPLGARIITANPNKLPLPVQSFLATQFPNLRITIIKIDADTRYHYEVLLSDGSSIVFPKRGNWTKIQGGMGNNIPVSLLPDNIQKYLESIHASQMIGSVTRDKSRYDILLHDGSLLSFNKKGELEAKE